MTRTSDSSSSTSSTMDEDDVQSRRGTYYDNNATSRPITAPVHHHQNGSISNNNHGPTRASTAPTQPSSSSFNDQNVRVVARVRPLSTKELSEHSSESIRALPSMNSINVSLNNNDNSMSSSSGGGGGDKRRFEFDSVFGPMATQRQVYEGTAGDMIETSIYKGFNATILAYGQVSTTTTT